MIAHRQGGHAFANCLDNAATFMAQDAGEHAFGVGTGQGVGISVADTGSHDPHQHLAGLGRRHVDFDDLQRLVGGERHGGARLDHSRCSLLLGFTVGGRLAETAQRTAWSGSNNDCRGDG
ncbi:hypothetical protein D9M69_635860 [compost metagenome]